VLIAPALPGAFFHSILFDHENSLRSREWIISWLTPTLHAPAVYASCSASPPPHAVFKFIASSYFVGACTGRSAGFSPLRMAVDVARGAPVLIDPVSSTEMFDNCLRSCRNAPGMEASHPGIIFAHRLRIRIVWVPGID
jgi:hypothetical protein